MVLPTASRFAHGALTVGAQAGLLPGCLLVVVSPHLRQFNSRLLPRKIMTQETNNARFGA